MKYIYVIILTLLFIGVDYAQLSTPSGYTTNMRLRKYAQGANAGADSINANWTAIDTYTKAVLDTAQVKVNLYGNQTIAGTKTVSGVLSFGAAGKLKLGSQIPDSAGQIGYTGTLVRWFNGTAMDTLADLGDVRAAVVTDNRVRILWSSPSTSEDTTATMLEYNYGSATSASATTTQNIKVPLYITGDEDSLVCRFKAYYFLDGNTITIARARFYINGDAPFTDAYYGDVEITTDDGAGYGNYKLSADISALTEGLYYIYLTATMDLDTYGSGTALIKITQPTIYVRY